MTKASLTRPLARSLPRELADRRRAPRLTTERPAPSAHCADPAVQRVRRAGGPLDRASYSCQCGYVFLAPVSTTVACPHCRAPQAW
ncbi:MAG: hypothetical protein M3Z95_03080 [Actinomycetota bacterium]|nr:hypothetical protein [Actinomycetota bacterium]